mmetsp:Transcript_26006/g.50603  ORF Transcript_26006/g.50603 Transcript_26006/m.50603 type:complete len:527 (+) Transcript_26006:39-1619(+)
MSWQGFGFRLCLDDLHDVGPRNLIRAGLAGEDDHHVALFGQALLQGGLLGLAEHLVERELLVGQPGHVDGVDAPDKVEHAGGLDVLAEREHGLRGALARHLARDAPVRGEAHDGGRGHVAGDLAGRGDERVVLVGRVAGHVGVHALLVLVRLFDCLDDVFHGVDCFQRVRAAGGLGTQHQGVSAVVDSVGNVRRLRTGGGRSEDHGIKHLGGHHDGGTLLLALGDDGFLHGRDRFDVGVYTEVTTSHHHGIRLLDDLGELTGIDRGFDLRHDERVVADQSFGLNDVFLGPHAAEGNPVHAHLQAKLDILDILVSESPVREVDFRDIHTVVGAEAATSDDLQDGFFHRRGHHPGVHAATSERNDGAWRHVREDLGVREGDAGVVSNLLLQVQDKPLALLHGHGSVFEFSDTELRALEVHEDADGGAMASLDLTDQVDSLPGVLVRAVAHRDAEDVGASLPHGLNHLFIARRGTDGRNHLGLRMAVDPDRLLVRLSLNHGLDINGKAPDGSARRLGRATQPKKSTWLR